LKIIKSWFYKLSEIVWENITIEKDLIVTFFDDSNKNCFIEIWENSKVEMYWILENSNNFKLKVNQNKLNSNLKIHYLILANNNIINWTKNNVKIESILNADFVKSNLKILSIVWDDWVVNLDWIIKIEEGIKKVDWNLDEENIFLWNTGVVNWIPTLLVRSDDVKASHACKIEKISDEKLFYLRAKWIWKENALQMMVVAKIENLFSCLNMYSPKIYDKLIGNILNKI